MIGVINASEYYQILRSGPLLGQLYSFGQFCWAPSLFLPEENRDHVIRSKYSESRGAYEYSIDRTDYRTEFEGRQEPNYDLGTGAFDRALIVRAKRRPVIIVSLPVENRRDPKRVSEECFLTVPVYSFAGDETKKSYSPEFIARVQGYIYPQFFYLPESLNRGLREGFARFDRIQVVRKDLLEQIPLMLSDDSSDLVRYWLRVYHGEDLQELDDVLYQYRNQAIESLRSQGYMP